MSRSRTKRHARKAFWLLSLGAVLAIAPAIGMYNDTDRNRLAIWASLLLASLPAVGWGSAHLARARGYPTEAGCGISFIGYLASGFLGTTSQQPLVLGTGILFIVLLPVVVMLSLPSKAGNSDRGRR
jgi:hypothetical protein